LNVVVYGLNQNAEHTRYAILHFIIHLYPHC
jgi:hypothetical protein